MLGHVYTGSGFRETLFVFAVSKDSIIAILVSNRAVIDSLWTSITYIRCAVESFAPFFDKVRTGLVAGRTGGAFDTTENDFATCIDFFTMISVNTEVMCIIKATFVIPITQSVQPDFL